MDEHVNIVAHIFALEKPTLSTTAGERVFVQEVRRKGLVETRVRGLLLRDLLPLEPNASPLVEDRHDVLLLRQPRFGVPSGVHSRGSHCCSLPTCCNSNRREIPLKPGPKARVRVWWISTKIEGFLPRHISEASFFCGKKPCNIIWSSRARFVHFEALKWFHFAVIIES